jgi:hypothetical protein
MKSRKNDYLKYWKVIRQFIKSKYGIGQADLDMLLFLYSEGYFKKTDFLKFNNILSWDVNRFERMRQNDWISVFRKGVGRTCAIYELSYKGTRMIDSIYKKLSGEEIPSTMNGNPMFHRNVKYSDKVYKNMIIEMNKEIRDLRQRQRLTPE